MTPDLDRALVRSWTHLHEGARPFVMAPELSTSVLWIPKRREDTEPSVVTRRLRAADLSMDPSTVWVGTVSWFDGRARFVVDAQRSAGPICTLAFRRTALRLGQRLGLTGMADAVMVVRDSNADARFQDDALVQAFHQQPTFMERMSGGSFVRLASAIKDLAAVTEPGERYLRRDEVRRCAGIWLDEYSGSDPMRASMVLNLLVLAVADNPNLPDRADRLRVQEVGSYLLRLGPPVLRPRLEAILELSMQYALAAGSFDDVVRLSRQSLGRRQEAVVPAVPSSEYRRDRLESVIEVMVMDLQSGFDSWRDIRERLGSKADPQGNTQAAELNDMLHSLSSSIREARGDLGRLRQALEADDVIGRAQADFFEAAILERWQNQDQALEAFHAKAESLALTPQVRRARPVGIRRTIARTAPRAES